MQHDAAAQTFLKSFSDPVAVTRYAEGPPRFVPGFADLHRMTASCSRSRLRQTRACWCWAPAVAWSSRHWRRPNPASVLNHKFVAF